MEEEEGRPTQQEGQEPQESFAFGTRESITFFSHRVRRVLLARHSTIILPKKRIHQSTSAMTTENAIVILNSPLDEDRLHDFLIKVAGERLKLPLERGMIAVGDDEYSCIFDPGAKTLEVRHRRVNVGWIYNTTTKETLLNLSVQLAAVQQKTAKTAAWGTHEPEH